jgi:PIN domain nuclease of toxin-antitoxin system
LFGEQDSIHRDVKVLLEDYANSLFVSSVAVQEMILLFRIGKLNSKYNYRNERDLIHKIEELNIQTVYFSKENDLTYCELQIADSHKDMNDHLIISQAISDKIPLISSDYKFRTYIEQGLNFIYNRR